MRLIDADALMEVFRGDEGADALDHFSLRLIKVKRIVDNAPTIPAIPVEWMRKVMMNDVNDSNSSNAAFQILELWQKEQEADIARKLGIEPQK